MTENGMYEINFLKFIFKCYTRTYRKHGYDVGLKLSYFRGLEIPFELKIS